MNTSSVDGIIRFARLLKSSIFSVLFGAVMVEIRRRIYSNGMSYGQYFDLTVDAGQPASPVPLRLRELSERDLPWLFYNGISSVDAKELRTRVVGLMLVNSGISGCYVAVNSEDIPCAVCWAVLPDENIKLRRYFGNGLPELEEYEVLLENVYTRPSYRGKGLMKWITMSLFRKAAALGARKAISFVHSHNGSSQRGSERIGWQRYLKKIVLWRFFRRKVTFEPWGKGTE